MSFNIIVKNYQHYNRAMGKHITSRKHYEQEMQKGGYIPFEKAEQMAESARKLNHKDYNGLSEDKMKFLHQVKNLADKKGNIPITNRFVEGLKVHKVISGKSYYDRLPSHYGKGGFDG